MKITIHWKVLLTSLIKYLTIRVITDSRAIMWAFVVYDVFTEIENVFKNAANNRKH
jgi:hypothetical protein